MRGYAMPPETLHFADYQATFAARLRDPRGAPRPPGASARRMRVYEELLFNNLEGFLQACYPVTRKTVGARTWRKMVGRFFAEHRCHSPLFRDIPEAFLDWVGGQNATDFPNPPFLADFMHYEWLELAVSVSPHEPDMDTIDPEGDLLAGHPALHPTARLACYRYPVHRIGPRFKPHAQDGQSHCYLLYRDGADEVRFSALNAVSARLVEMLRNERPSGRQALARIAAELNHSHPDVLIQAGHELLMELRRSGALLGTWRETCTRISA
jgi:uncharacterized protein